MYPSSTRARARGAPASGLKGAGPPRPVATVRTVVDTSAFLGGRPLPEPATIVVPEGVVEELALPGRDRRRLEASLAGGAVVMRPDVPARQKAREAALRTGDLPRMSATDLDLLALAVELGAEILSDDYRVQNVGRALGVEVRASDQRGIREAWEWVPRCTGCRRVLDAPREDCPVCGSPVKLVKRR